MIVVWSVYCRTRCEKQNMVLSRKTQVITNIVHSTDQQGAKRLDSTAKKAHVKWIFSQPKEEIEEEEMMKYDKVLNYAKNANT
ncbi:hypothetical protein AKO1_006841 [Acrasis kona]|uniref:Uncharacterized protein n=1 Tax=Acrasis kona TaxID=1008807 RepID=A0AAW2YUQ9_9EUKA